MKKNIIFLFLSVFILSASFLACSSKPRKPKGGDKVHTVSLVDALLEEIPNTLELKGTFVPSDKLDVKSELDGKVISALAQEGQILSMGDPLAVLDADKVKLLLDKQRLELVETERRIEAGLNLLQAPVLEKERRADANETEGRNETAPADKESLSEFEDIAEKVNPDEVGEEIPKTPDLLAKNESVIQHNLKTDLVLRAEEATLDRLKADIALNERKLESANINASIEGTVSRKNITEGSVVTAGEFLYQIVRLDPIYLSVFVAKETISQFKKDDRIEVFSDEVPGQSLSGEIIFVAPEADPQNKNYEVKISVYNTQQKLKGGLSGKIFIPLPEVKKSIQVPLDTVQEKSGKSYVYAVEGELATRKEVSLGRKAGDKVEIKKGVKEGDKLVSKGLSSLSENQEYVKVGI